jgi:hypothetical protein
LSLQYDPWRELELIGVQTVREFRVSDTGLVLSSGPVLYALDGAGLYHLLLPIPENTPVLADRRSAGVHIEKRHLEEGGERRTYVDVVCTRARAREVFRMLASDMLQHVGEDVEHPVEACRRVLSRWRELLERATSEVLSQEALAGLFGELWQLSKIAVQHADAHLCWNGPSGGIHDFSFGTTALEVKTTLAREGSLFEINGVDQLQAPPEGVLYLSVMRLSDGTTGDTSVPDLIDALIGMGVDRLELFRRLGAAGYDSRDSDHYRGIRYAVKEARVYLVDQDFPRITRDSFAFQDLPPRIQRLRYTIDLAGEPPVPLPADEVDALHARLAASSVAP